MMYGKTPSRKKGRTRIAPRVREWEIVGSGRRWNEGRGALPKKGHYLDALAPVYEFRAERWYPRAFGYESGFGRPSTRSHQADWLDCMGRTPGERHRISKKGERVVSEGPLQNGEGATNHFATPVMMDSCEGHSRMTCISIRDAPTVQTCFTTLERIGGSCPRRLGSRVHVFSEEIVV